MTSPTEYFERHPAQFWLALSWPVLTTVYAITRMRRASARRQARRYGVLAALTAGEAVALVRIRPGTV